MRATTIAAFTILLSTLQPAAAQDATEIGTYFGAYKGIGVTINAGTRYKVQNRDLDVAIAAAPNGGFGLTSTVIARGGFIGRSTKRSSHTLVFVPGGQPRLWRAATSKPIAAGGPTILARLNARGLHVYVMAFDKAGRLHTSVYRRWFRDKRTMVLVYRRTRSGRNVRGTLWRKKWSTNGKDPTHRRAAVARLPSWNYSKNGDIPLRSESHRWLSGKCRTNVDWRHHLRRKSDRTRVNRESPFERTS